MVVHVFFVVVKAVHQVFVYFVDGVFEMCVGIETDLQDLHLLNYRTAQLRGQVLLVIFIDFHAVFIQ